METEADIVRQIAALEARLPAVRLAQAVTRTAAFLHTAETPVWERIGPFQVAPITLHRFEVMRLCGSPLLSGRTPEPVELALFLWFLSPEYTFTDSRAKRRHFKKCRQLFFPPPKPLLRTELAMILWHRRVSVALANEAMLLKAARDYLAEAMADRPQPGGTLVNGRPEYYCDTCAICAALAREFGWSELAIITMPLKRVFQYLNEIKETRAAQNGCTAVDLWNGEDDIYDQMLALMNQRN